VVSGGLTGPQPQPVFHGGDYTYPNSQQCLFYSTDALHVCTVEPCDNGTFPLGEPQAGPAFGFSGSTSPITSAFVGFYGDEGVLSSSSSTSTSTSTSGSLTTKSLTTKALTSGALTTHSLTSGSLTSGALTTRMITTQTPVIPPITTASHLITSGIHPITSASHPVTTSHPQAVTTSVPPAITTSVPPVITTSVHPVITTSVPPVITTGHNGGSSGVIQAGNCARVSVLSLSQAVVTSIDAWGSGSTATFHIIVEIHVQEAILNMWYLEVVFPSNQITPRLTQVLNGGSLLCSGNTPVPNAVIQPLSWDKNVPSGTTITVEIFGNNLANLSPNEILSNTILQVFTS